MRSTPSLLQEATIDSRFNAAMAKVQDGIEKLEAISKEFSPRYPRPVKSQQLALEVAIKDLEKIKKTIDDILK